VSIGDTVHFMSHYYDNVLRDPHRPASDIVAEIMQRLSAPLLTTSVTTAVGFLSLMFAEMPPFIVFGLFTVLGILLSWLLTITLIPAALSLMRPKVGNYLAKRRTIRVHAEQSQLTRALVGTATVLHRRRGLVTLLLLGIVAVSALGTSRLFVDSSWLSDFRDDSELVRANAMFNDKFDGTIFLNMVIEGREPGTFRNPELLRGIENVQKLGESLPYVGSSRSIVDYIKNVNKTLHAGDPAYDVIPETEQQVGEFLFLLSISGRPELLEEVIDYEYQQALVTYAIKTDHTQDLRLIIDRIRESADSELAGMNVDVNFAGSANNSYIWAQLLIGSQTMAIVLSKVGIFLLAALLFKSVLIALFTIVPVTLTTLFIAGFAGFAGIPLDVSTALAAGVAIGVGVDYAIHYIFRYRDEAARHHDALAATQATMRSVGKTIVFSACVVTVGFGVLCFSQFPPHAKLGYFVAAYMVISCLVALITLPLLYYFRDRIRGAGQSS
jgi:predicted RND superfamily exporter protein